MTTQIHFLKKKKTNILFTLEVFNLFIEFDFCNVFCLSEDFAFDAELRFATTQINEYKLKNKTKIAQFKNKSDLYFKTKILKQT